MCAHHNWEIQSLLQLINWLAGALALAHQYKGTSVHVAYKYIAVLHNCKQAKSYWQALHWLTSLSLTYLQQSHIEFTQYSTLEVNSSNWTTLVAAILLTLWTVCQLIVNRMFLPHFVGTVHNTHHHSLYCLPTSRQGTYINPYKLVQNWFRSRSVFTLQNLNQFSEFNGIIK